MKRADPQTACPECRRPIPDRPVDCPDCGFTLRRFCACGAINHEFDRACPSCGLARRTRVPEPGSGRGFFRAGLPALGTPRFSRRRLILAVVLAAAVATGVVWNHLRPDPVRTLRVAEAAWDGGRYAEAAIAYGEYIGMEPGRATAHCRLGFALLRTGDEARGLAEIERAVALDRALAPARLFLSRRAEAEGDLEKALVHCRSAKGSPAARVREIRLLIDTDRIGAAIAVAQEFLSSREPDGEFARVRFVVGELLLYRSFLFLRDLDSAHAMRFFGQVESALRGAADGPSTVLRARALARMGRSAEALYLVVHGDTAGAPPLEVLLLRAAGHDGQKDTPGAARLLSEASGGDLPKETGIRIARFWMERGDLERLRSGLAEALRAHPDDVDLLALDGFALAVAGEAPAAFESLAPRIGRIAASGGALRCFVRVARLAETHERALELLSKEEGTRSVLVARAALRMVGAISRQQVGDFRGADPLDPETLLLSGEIRHRFSGQMEEPGGRDAERYAVFAERLAASSMSSSGERLRREAALRGYGASARELRAALADMDREVL